MMQRNADRDEVNCAASRRAGRSRLPLPWHVRMMEPEMSRDASGDSDGLHFGLWYDTADEAIAVVHDYARDSAETWIDGDHPLSVCRHRWRYDEPPPDETGFAIRLDLEELAWFEEEERRARRPGRCSWRPTTRSDARRTPGSCALTWRCETSGRWTCSTTAGTTTERETAAAGGAGLSPRVGGPCPRAWW